MSADIADRVISALARHPTVRSVRLAGSRERGDARYLSDWDFAVDTDNFSTVAGDLTELLG
ncbi:MAG: nucleotidyltransferase domain-containing protein [Dehalococcoidia bacterium]